MSINVMDKDRSALDKKINRMVNQSLRSNKKKGSGKKNGKR